MMCKRGLPPWCRRSAQSSDDRWVELRTSTRTAGGTCIGAVLSHAATRCLPRRPNAPLHVRSRTCNRNCCGSTDSALQAWEATICNVLPCFHDLRHFGPRCSARDFCHVAMIVVPDPRQLRWGDKSCHHCLFSIQFSSDIHCIATPTCRAARRSRCQRPPSWREKLRLTSKRMSASSFILVRDSNLVSASALMILPGAWRTAASPSACSRERHLPDCKVLVDNQHQQNMLVHAWKTTYRRNFRQ
jgi:hypothetical protein